MYSEQLDLFAFDDKLVDTPPDIAFGVEADIMATLTRRFEHERRRYTDMGQAFPFDTVLSWWYSVVVGIATNEKNRANDRLTAFRLVTDLISTKSGGVDDSRDVPFAIIGDETIRL